MAMITPYNDEYRKWSDIDLSENPFVLWQSILAKIDIDVEAALHFFTLDFFEAVTNYTDQYIMVIFGQVLTTAGDKYARMIDAVQAKYNPLYNADATEECTDTRTPDLKQELTLTATSAMTDTRKTTLTLDTEMATRINQTRTTTDTPTDLTSVNVHFVNPFDNTGYKEESKDQTTQTGSNTQTESYNGNPDTTTNSGTNITENAGGTSTTSSGTNTQTNTGTETLKHESRRYGNIGVTSSQKLINEELDLTERLNIFKVIEQDIARKLFLQVWI